MNKSKPKTNFYFDQIYRIRKAAIYVALFCMIVFLIFDYLRFSGEVYNQVLFVRLVYQVFPCVFILICSFYQKSRTFTKSRLNYLIAACVFVVGVGHAQIYEIAHINAIYFPKFGLGIVLFYAGILLVLPISQALATSICIILFAVYTYYTVGVTQVELITVTVFYSVFSACCILMNWICAKILIENNKMIKKINNLANTDNLTGLFNRRFFIEQGNESLKLATKRDKSVVVMMIDLDNFKRANDILGHHKGDLLLIEVAKIINSKCKRSLDKSARFGGDEFVVLFYDADIDYINHVCSDIIVEIESLSQSLESVKNIKNFGVSIGVAQRDGEDGFSLKTMIDMADNALYEAKKSGKNTFNIYDKNQYYQPENTGEFLSSLNAKS